jgi:hypothetical protein
MGVPDWKQPKRSELIAKYTDKPVTRYQQFDGFINAEEDSLIQPDQDSDAIMGGTTYELMRFDFGVRVLIPDNIEAADAARALTKIADVVDQYLDMYRRRRDEDNRDTPTSDFPF